MINLFSGTPGSGKSLHMAKMLMYLLNRRKESLVICNFEIDLSRIKHPERFIYVSNYGLTPEFLRLCAIDWYHDHELREGSISLFIDECQIIFNARQWNMDGRSDWLVFFTQHRKYGFNVYLTAQFDLMIDKQIRALLEYEVVHRKITNFGVIGGLLQLFLLGKPLFIAVERWYSLNEKTGSSYFFARKKYYRLYDTFNTFSVN